jgi:hypothetical protein
MNGFWFLIALMIIVALIPPKYDPAIRLKEWFLKRNGK